MGRTVLPTAAILAVTLATVLAVVLALATPAYPQISSADLAADEEGNLVGPRPPEYEVTEDGTLIIGGDVLVACSDVGRPPDPSELRGATPEAKAQIEQARRENIQACQAAGFDTAGDLPASASPSPGASATSDATTPASASASPDASTAEGDDALPETGGPALPPAPPLLAAAVLLSAGGLLALRARR